MKGFHLTICTPEGTAFDGEAVRLIVRTASGDAAILRGHIPYAAVLAPGRLRLTVPGGEERESRCGRGILTVGKERTLVLAEQVDKAPLCGANKNVR